MYVVAIALAVPGIRIAIFSTGSRASNTMLQTMLGMLKAIPNGRQRVVKVSKEELFLAARPLEKGMGPNSQAARDLQTDPTTSKITAFPSSVNGIYLSCLHCARHMCNAHHTLNTNKTIIEAG